MIILGLTGPINHGKSTFADILLRLEPDSRMAEFSGLIAEVANDFNARLLALNGIPDHDAAIALKSWLDTNLPLSLRAATEIDFNSDDLTIQPEHVASHPGDYVKLDQYLNIVKSEPAMLQTKISPENKADYRHILQWIGGYVTDRLGRSIWCEELIARAMKSSDSTDLNLFILGGVRLPVDAEAIHSHQGIVGEILMPARAIADPEDPTERLRAEIATDFRILNNGTLEQLKNVGVHLLADLSTGTLETTYTASGGLA